MIAVPTCCRCRTRKIRCDRKAPQCSSCEKARSLCLIEDQSRKQTYSRQYAQKLIDEVQRLEALAGTSDRFDAESTWPHGSLTPAASTEPVIDTGGDDPSASGQRFVGDSSGTSFLRYIFESESWRAAQEDLARFIGQYQSLPRQPVSSHDWPTFQQARLLVDSYLTNSHVHHPFLDPAYLLQALQRVYASQDHQPSPQNSYSLFMVFAVASVRTFRKGLTDSHPYGYFLAAQQYLDQISVLGNIEAIQNLLLITRFGMYHDINTSLWELSQICVRQCIELNLHLRTDSAEPADIQQLQRCIFWDCYMNERYSSTTLGRPFAIADSAIETPLPMEASFEQLRTLSHDTLSINRVQLDKIRTPNDGSVFLFVIGLRRIQSANRTIFNRRDSLTMSISERLLSTTPGFVMLKVRDCLSELDEWLTHAPRFDCCPSLYHSFLWYSFLVEKEKLSVVRAAIASLSSFRTATPPLEGLLVSCSSSALRVIELFSTLFESHRIVPTRRYFQDIFVSGLSLMFCQFDHIKTSTVRNHATRERTIPEPGSRVRLALSTCAQILQQLSKEMPDSRTFYLVFEALKRKFSAELRSSTGTETGTAPSIGSTSIERSHNTSPSHGQRQNNSGISSDGSQSSLIMEDGVQQQGLHMSLLDTQNDVTMSDLGEDVERPIHNGFDAASHASCLQTMHSSLFQSHPPVRASESNLNTSLPDQMQMASLTYRSVPVEGELDWTTYFSEEVIEQMVAEVGDFVWDQPVAGSSIWNTLDFHF